MNLVSKLSVDSYIYWWHSYLADTVLGIGELDRQDPCHHVLYVLVFGLWDWGPSDVVFGLNVCKDSVQYGALEHVIMTILKHYSTFTTVSTKLHFFLSSISHVVHRILRDFLRFLAKIKMCLAFVVIFLPNNPFAQRH